jgi:energy-converting hydrogenase Eha subunit B
MSKWMDAPMSMHAISMDLPMWTMAAACMWMPWTSVVATARPMWMPMAFVTMWTDALVRWMNAAFATDPGTSMSVGAQTFPQLIATVMATKKMPLVSAEVLVKMTRMPMAFATMWTNALVRWMNVAFATDPGRFTNAGALTSPQEIAIAMATSLTPAAVAMDPGTFTSAGAPTSPQEIAIAMATSLTPWRFAAAIVLQMRMPMAFATM